jgi:hypothetical protein
MKQIKFSASIFAEEKIYKDEDSPYYGRNE